jgi:hypothetical protein
MGAFYLFLFVDRTLLQSLLIEGRGKYNCALDPGSNGASPSCLPCNASNPECAYHVIPVEHGKTYRLRIASITSLSSLNFVLEVGFAGQAEEDRLELSSSSCRFLRDFTDQGFLVSSLRAYAAGS